MYSLIKPLLFKLDPEFSHWLALSSLRFAYRSNLLPQTLSPISSIKLFTLNFPNRIGLAAGFDKNGDYIDELAALGFGFIEIGTLTPKPQLGNPKPRLFRLPKQQAIINRMGFNNKGVDYAVQRLAKIKYKGILGINIGKNKDTPNDIAHEDYLISMRKLWPFASYFVINISSPNTAGLRELQQEKYLSRLLSTLKHAQAEIANNHQRYIPLLVKIAPDLTDDEVYQLAKTFLNVNIDGVIATNTSLQRFGISSKEAAQAGGISGAPLTNTSTHVISLLHEVLGEKIPIIASGGVMDESSALDKIKAGASLVQLYSGLIFQGPTLINKLVRKLK